MPKTDGRIKTYNVFAVQVQRDSDRHVHEAIVSVVAKSPTAALATAMTMFDTAARDAGKSMDVDSYTVTFHGAKTYTVKAFTFWT